MKMMLRSQPRRPHSPQGFTVAELMVAVAISTIAFAIVGALSLYALRSFTAMSNYADLDSKSNLALDRFSYDLRKCTGLLAYDKNAANRFFLFTNRNEMISVRVAWDQAARVLVTTKMDIYEGAPRTQVFTNLTECEFWDYQLFQQTPVYNKTNEFVAFGPGARCKLINMTWKCSRTMLKSQKWNTESVQTAKIVLRNAR